MRKTGSYWAYPLSHRIKQNLEEIQEDIIEAKKNREEWLIQTYHIDVTFGHIISQPGLHM